MNLKKQLNRQIYVSIIKNKSPEQRLLKTFELSQMIKTLFYESFKQKYSHLDPSALHKKYLEYLQKCHNKNY